jgi:hypothetical protein
MLGFGQVISGNRYFLVDFRLDLALNANLQVSPFPIDPLAVALQLLSTLYSLLSSFPPNSPLTLTPCHTVSYMHRSSYPRGE